MAARVVDHQRLLVADHLADLRVGDQIDAQLAHHRVVAGGHHPAGRALLVDQHQRAPFHGEPPRELLHHLEEQPVGVASCGEGTGHVEQRGQVLGLPQQLVAIEPAASERAQERRQVGRRMRCPHEPVQAVGEVRLAVGRQDADERRVALAGERDELGPIAGAQVDDGRGDAFAVRLAFHGHAGFAKRGVQGLFGVGEAEEGDCERSMQRARPAPPRGRA